MAAGIAADAVDERPVLLAVAVGSVIAASYLSFSRRRAAPPAGAQLRVSGPAPSP
jgi:hypothetical protein